MVEEVWFFDSVKYYFYFITALNNVRIHDGKTPSASPVSSQAVGGAGDASTDTTDNPMASASEADKNDRWIKEQTEKMSKRTTTIAKLLPQRANTLKSSYARRQEDVQYVVLQALVVRGRTSVFYFLTSKFIRYIYINIHKFT